MVEHSTIFKHADVEVALVAEAHGVAAGQARRRSDAWALQGGICGLVRALKPSPTQRQRSRVKFLFAFG
jgi:hypothetical protein